MEPIYSQPKNASESQTIVGYRAGNSITVIVRDLSKAGTVIDAATNAGANKLQGVTFELSDEKAAIVPPVSEGEQRVQATAGMVYSFS